MRVIPLVQAASRLRRGPIIWVFHDVPDDLWFQRCIDDILAICQVVPLTELATNRSRRDACAITFDDGRQSVYDVARPVLGRRALPYTVFVCTEVLTGGPVPWFMRATNVIDRLGVELVSHRWHLNIGRLQSRRRLIVALKDIPLDVILDGLDNLEDEYDVAPPSPADSFVSVGELKTLAEDGVEIGAHTHRHPILSRLSLEEQRFEIEENIKTIYHLTATIPTTFAYPNGTALDFDATTLAILRRNNIDTAVTTIPKHVDIRDDCLTLPRIGLDKQDSDARRVAKTVAPWLSMSSRREQWLRRR